MASQADFFPRSAGQRCAIRVLFLAWILIFVVETLVRKNYGEPYPGLFMPSFAGTGLVHMTRTEGETDLVHITVTFTDQTTLELSPKQLSGDALFPSQIVSQMFRAPITPGSPENPGAFRPVMPDAKRFLYARLRVLYSNKTPASMVFIVDRESVQLDHPQSTKVVDQVAQRTISFTDENAD